MRNSSGFSKGVLVRRQNVTSSFSSAELFAPASAELLGVVDVVVGAVVV